MIITVAIQKGGTGKTATAGALAQCLNHHNHKTLLIDTDTQGSLISHYGGDKTSKGIYEAIVDRIDTHEVVQHCVPGDVIAPGRRLDRLKTTISRTSKSTLQDALKGIKNDYEHIIIDTAPRSDHLLEDCLTVSDGLIIPMEADADSFQAMRETLKTYYEHKKRHKDLKVIAMLITRYDGRSNISQQYREVIEEYCEELQLPSPVCIRNNVAIKEASALRMSLYKYKSRSNVAQDYRALLKDLHLI